MSDTEVSKGQLTDEESQRYDRQIRIWGADAQLRLQKSRVFISGFSGLNCEVIKNIVLMGVSVVIHDINLVKIDDLSYNFFLREDSVGLNTAEAIKSSVQELNTLAKVSTCTVPLEKLNDDYFLSFNNILLSNCSEKNVIRISKLCRKNIPNIALFWSDVFGQDGWFVSDFGENFEYLNDPPNNKAINSIQCKSIEEIINTRWTDMISNHFPLSLTYISGRLLSLFRERFNESPNLENKNRFKLFANELIKLNGLQEDIITEEYLNDLCKVSSSITVLPCSVLGSFLSQEVVKAISRSGRPYSNIWLFNTESFEVKGYPI